MKKRIYQELNGAWGKRLGEGKWGALYRCYGKVKDVKKDLVWVKFFAIFFKLFEAAYYILKKALDKPDKKVL